jgi:hypothetical protein
MEPLSMMTGMSVRALSEEARSALPDAPVVAGVERTPATVRVREAAAATLHRLADVVAPRRATVCAD